MRTLVLGFGILTSLTTFALPRAFAQSPPDSAALYALGPKSSFTYGCFAPCLCPIFSSQQIRGTFQLRHVGFDGLFDNYEVSNVRWTRTQDTTGLVITGSGLYRIGGEVAIQKQMVLNLRFGNDPPQRFDSGLIGGENDFPRIEIDVSLHQATCFDSVIHVQAAPAVPTAVDADLSTPGFIRVTPNPFSHETRFELSLAAPGPVELAIYDAQGRLVRFLLRDAWHPAGTREVLWDGRGEQGGECASGVYFLRGRIGGRASALRIVKAR